MDIEVGYDIDVLVVGEGKLASSIVVNMVNAGHETTWLKASNTSMKNQVPQRQKTPALSQATWIDRWPDCISQRLVIGVVEERIEAKQRFIEQVERRSGGEVLVGVNSDSIPLENIHETSRRKERVLGLNWSYPANHTLFLEILSNGSSDGGCLRWLEQLAKVKWEKDAYTVSTGISVRGRMMAAWLREAFYLVQNGYASFESIDRACRNDPGYYLPFAGNFRYMDLMGTYAYGTVMKDLNPELSKATCVDEELMDQLDAYLTRNAPDNEVQFEEFSKDIRTLILAYPHEKMDS